jgi:hypothetical protein
MVGYPEDATPNDDVAVGASRGGTHVRDDA